jgi:hypothetical protein
MTIFHFIFSYLILEERKGKMEHNSGRPRAFTTTGSHIGGTTREEEDPMALQMDGSAQLSILNSLLSSTNKAKFLVRSPPSWNVRSFVVFVLF